MKINRRAADFFKQACLDVMEVMSVRGMGVALNGDTPTAPSPSLYGALSLRPANVAPPGRRADRDALRAARPAADQRPRRRQHLRLARPSTRSSSSPSRSSGRTRCSAACSARQAGRRVRFGRHQAAQLDRQRVGDLPRERDAVRGRARPDDGPAAQPHQRRRRQGRLHLRPLRARRAAQPPPRAADRACPSTTSSRSTWPACCTTSARSACPRRCCRRPASSRPKSSSR